MLLCWLCVSSCVYAPWLGPFRRTPLALHCTEGSSRGACAIPLGGCRLYSPECREGFFSETGLPINGLLGKWASGTDYSRKPSWQFGCFILASLLENQGVDDEEASAEEVIGVCWFCGAKLKDGYDRDVVCRECLGEEEE